MELTVRDCATKLGKSTSVVEYFHENKENFDFLYYYNFLLTRLPQSLIQEEDVLRKINDKFTIKNIGISKFYPYINHTWHTDTRRGVTINMLLQHTRSNVMFRYQSGNKELNFEENFNNKMNYNLIEVNYEPNNFYLYNTQIEHEVFNFENERYIFTMEFEQDKTELNYYDVLRYYESL